MPDASADSIANANQIVRAWNSYNGLLEALKGLETHQARIITKVRNIVNAQDGDSQTRQNAWDKFITLLDDYLAVANAAIAKAGK